jgi:hypothetical protein
MTGEARTAEKDIFTEIASVAVSGEWSLTSSIQTLN